MGDRSPCPTAPRLRCAAVGATSSRRPRSPTPYRRRPGYAKPIWLAETYRLTHSDFPHTEANQIPFLTREVVEILAQPELQRVFWYGWLDLPPGVSDGVGVLARGIVRADHTPKAAFAILPHTIEFTRGAREDASTETVVAYRFAPDEPRGPAHVVAWSRSGRSSAYDLRVAPGAEGRQLRFPVPAVMAGARTVSIRPQQSGRGDPAMTIPVYQVDAFTDRPFAGNPAAVCFLSGYPEDAWMRSVAAEMNLSETAFVSAGRGGAYDLRWFTPAVEVDLCGHATLATAHVLWETGRLGTGEAARFHTRSGMLSAVREGGAIAMDFPATPSEACARPVGLEAALGVEAVAVGRSRFDLMVEVGSETDVRRIRPNIDGLREIEARGIIVTARGRQDADHDFVSRFFCPRVGIAEDPVTGSAHCTLAPYWAERLGRLDLVGYQASARGGTVGVRCAGDRVTLVGRAVTVLRGELAA